MSTVTRPELSEKNRWWIGKHRYYELRHFCLQYPEWISAVKEIDGLSATSSGRSERINPGRTGDPTAVMAEARMRFSDRIALIESAAYDACDHQFWYTILVQAVTEGISYEVMEAKLGIMPIARGEWYDLYRKFFWVLDKRRD